MTELGSAHTETSDLCKLGVHLALHHNLIAKPVLQDALRCDTRLQLALQLTSVGSLHSC